MEVDGSNMSEWGETVLGEKQIGLCDESRGCFWGHVRVFEFGDPWPESEFGALPVARGVALNC